MAPGGKRRKREQAAQVLYGLSFSPVSDLAQLEKAFVNLPDESGAANKPSGFAWDLTAGVWQKQAELDQEIERFATNWRPDQIGRIERALLRMALYEMLNMNTPPRVAIAEYLELAGEFGAEKAKSFINGILNAAARANPATAAQIKYQKGK